MSGETQPVNDLTLLSQLAIVGDEHANLAGRAYIRIRVLEDALDAAQAGDGLGSGVITECPLPGVHDHPFRGPHRFAEWYEPPKDAER